MNNEWKQGAKPLPNPTSSGIEKMKRFHFGYDGAYTYLDGASDAVREAYRKRHYANATEKKLIDGLTPSASLLSYYLIWGESRNMDENIKTLNRMWKK